MSPQLTLNVNVPTDIYKELNGKIPDNQIQAGYQTTLRTFNYDYSFPRNETNSFSDSSNVTTFSQHMSFNFTLQEQNVPYIFILHAIYIGNSYDMSILGDGQMRPPYLVDKDNKVILLAD